MLRRRWSFSKARGNSTLEPVTEVGAHAIETELASSLPSPVYELRNVPKARAGLWVKDDGRLGTTYGGNKLRKLGPFLGAALQKGHRRVVTFGSVGSHHVLATGLFARAAGLEAHALVFAQRETPHVLDVLRASVASGLRLHAGELTHAREHVRSLMRLLSGTTFIPPGPLGGSACLGYADAVHELAAQVRSGALPCPRTIVVAAGSGGTAAGLLVGLAETHLSSRVLAVSIVQQPAMRPLILAQARAAARLRNRPLGFADLNRRLSVTNSFLGQGYGWPTPAGSEAIHWAQGAGLRLEATYTGKGLAAALELSKNPALAGSDLLFWQTLSQHPMTRLLQQAPERDALPSSLRSLLLPLPTS